MSHRSAGNGWLRRPDAAALRLQVAARDQIKVKTVIIDEIGQTTYGWAQSNYDYWYTCPAISTTATISLLQMSESR